MSDTPHFSVPPFRGTTLADLNEFVATLNSVLSTIRQVLTAIQGQEGGQLAESADIDMQGHKILNLSPSGARNQIVPLGTTLPVSPTTFNLIGTGTVNVALLNSQLELVASNLNRLAAFVQNL